MKFLACVCAVVVTIVVTVRAHPVSTTTVAIGLEPDGRYVVTITADADPLITKLEVLSAHPLPAAPPAAGAARGSRLDTLTNALLAHVELAFDGRLAAPAVAPARVDDAGQATITLTGVAPGGARTITWSSSLMFGAYPLAVRASDGREVVQWLQGQERSDPAPLAGPDQARAIWRGVWLGFTHILPNGIDHILFVIGLFLLSGRPRQLLAQVSAFTLAHSITLGVSLYGVLSLSPRVVEPMIALSVAYVGVENLLTSKLRAWRIAIVFAFGLLHGLGFAEALASLHLARPELLSTLISFNAGVEGGQLAVIALAALALELTARLATSWRRPIVALASGAIGLIGLVWTVQRLW